METVNKEDSVETPAECFSENVFLKGLQGACRVTNFFANLFAPEGFCVLKRAHFPTTRRELVCNK